MSRKSTPVIGMSIFLVLLLAVVGVAYTQWTGSLEVQGSVGTTGLNVAWDDPAMLFCNDGTQLTILDETTVRLEFTDAILGHTDTCSLAFVNNGSLDVVVTDIIVDTFGVPANEFEVHYTNSVPPFDLLSGQSQAIDVTYTVGPDAQQFATYEFLVTTAFEQK